MRIVISPDSFTGSASAADAARALAVGWREIRPDDEVIELPLADGGVGTLEAVAAAIPAARWRDAGEVTGPDGRATPGRWLHLPDGAALIELAQCSGLPLMRRPDPLGAHTRGLGEVVVSALDAGATAIHIGLGGSASTDAGTGALAALGARFLDGDGRELPAGGAALARLAAVDASRLRISSVPVRLWCDVRAPLTGPAGAAAVFGPQKGADALDVRLLDDALTQAARIMGGSPESPGAGAAGGTAYGLRTLWHAQIVSGADEVARITGLDDALAGADLIVTGEGRLDATSATGKVVGSVTVLAEKLGVRVAYVAGRIDDGAARGRPSLALSDLAGSTDASMRDATHWLRVAGRRLAEQHNVSPDLRV